MAPSNGLHARSAIDLAGLLARREISAADLVRSCYRRADAIDPMIRSLVHRFDESALRAADLVDQARARGDALGPLAGLPITIKESIATEGLPVTLGVKAKQKKQPEADAVVVRLLREAGAIVIGKTNLSQLLLFHEAESAIWGTTHNPWNLERTPGGSSGGEAAALAAGLVPLGIGTDLGGSIRVPCAWTAIAGLKPTVDRWSNAGAHGALVGQEVVRAQLGPMARSSRDVAFLFQALDPARFAALDPAVPPLPAADPGSIDPKSLRFGFYDDDGFLRPAASVRRAVRQAARALERAGFAVKEIAPPPTPEIIDVYFSSLSSDGGAMVDKQLEGDAMVPQLKQLRQIAAMPAPVRKAAVFAMGIRGESRIKRLLEIICEKPVADLWQLTWRRTVLRREVAAAWDRAAVDLVICPAHATPALGHRESGDFTLAGSYSMTYNFLNFPAGVVPVTRVRPDETARPEVQDRLDRKAADIEKKSAGLPLGVQVVGRPWREDQVLAGMIALEDLLRSEPDFPATPVDPTRR